MLPFQPIVTDVTARQELKPVYTSKYGILYQGDCLKFLSALPDESVDLVFADPPFNLDKKYGTGIDDRMELDLYLDWSKQWLNESIRILKPIIWVDYSLRVHTVHSEHSTMCPHFNDLHSDRIILSAASRTSDINIVCLSQVDQMVKIDPCKIGWHFDASVAAKNENRKLLTHGDTYQIVVANGVEALESLIDAYNANGDRLPEPKLVLIRVEDRAN